MRYETQDDETQDKDYSCEPQASSFKFQAVCVAVKKYDSENVPGGTKYW